MEWDQFPDAESDGWDKFPDADAQPEPKKAEEPAPQPKRSFGDNFKAGLGVIAKNPAAIALAPAAAFESLTVPREKRSVTPENFARGIKEIGRDPSKLADIGEATVRGVAAPFGGDYVAAGAGKIVDTLQGEDAGNYLAQQRDRRAELADELPTTSAASTTAGYTGLGSLIAPLMPGRIIAQGAAVGGVGRTAETGDVGEGIVGAVEGAAGGALLKGIGATGNYLASTAANAARGISNAAERAGVPKAVTNVVNKFAGRQDLRTGSAVVRKRLVDADGRKLTDANLQQLHQNWVDTHGTEPTILDLVSEASRTRFARLSGTQTGAAKEFEAAGITRAAERPAEIGDAIAGGSRLESAKALEDAATNRYTMVMSEQGLGGRPLPATPELADILSDPNLRAGVPVPRLRQLIGDATQNGTPVTLRTLEDIATELNNATKDIRINKELAGKLRDYMRRAVPAYGRELDTYTGLRARAEGVRAGSKTVGDLDTDLQESVNAARQDPNRISGSQKALGMEAGAKTTAVERASTQRGAERVARDLTEPGAQSNMEAVLGEPEAARLGEVGRQQQQSIENYRAVQTDANRVTPSAADIRTGIATASLAPRPGRVSPVTLANIVSNGINVLKGMGLPPGAARGAARILTTRDPATIEILRRDMQRSGIDMQAFDALARQIQIQMAKEPQ